MTLNKSLFSFGIFKNTVYRFKWGSFLYLVALFFSVPFVLLVSDFDRLVRRVTDSSFYESVSIILRSDYLTLPMLLAVVVPTVVAVLVFNHVHSNKQGIFTHGLPVDRCTNYISNLAAAFALMVLPVLVNGTILMIMSFGKYGQVMSSMSVLYWTGLNLNMLFVMFSVAAFSAFLTGNAAAHIGINVFLHLIPVIIGLAIYVISEQLLYGFYQAENFIGNELINNSPIVWIFGRSLSEGNIFANLQTWIYIIGAAIVYVLGFFLYKNRKIEACGDVAAFKVFKPILKYAVSASAGIALFGMLVSIRMNAVAMFVMVLVICAIVYFATEMLMNKSFKVFKKTYKGFVGFVTCAALFISFFAYTSVFGYETRVPKLEDIESAGMFENWGWRDTLHFEESQLIENTVKVHKEIISDIPSARDYYMVRDYDGTNRYLYISYKLKNGEIMRRRYVVPFEVFDKAMAEMYKSEVYKFRTTKLDNVNIENVDHLVLAAHGSNFNFHIALNDDADDFMQAIKADIKQLSYEEMEKSNTGLNIMVEISCSAGENEKLKYFKNAGYDPNDTNTQYAYFSFSLNINPNYKNAYAFLKENGYYDQLVNQLGQSLVICKKPVSRAGEIYSFKGDTGRAEEFSISLNDCTKLSADDARRLAEDCMTDKRTEFGEGKYYVVYANSNETKDDLYMAMYMKLIEAEKLPDYLKKYVEE